MPINKAWMEYGKMSGSNGLLNAVDMVEEAANRVHRLVALEGAERNEAYKRIATRDRLSVGFLKAVSQPSRRPKSIAGHLWARLERAYVASLQRQIRRLEDELYRIERLGAHDAAAQALVDKAEALAREARRIAGHY